MSYIGKGLLHGSYIHNSFNGDGSTVNFTLSTSPGSANALLVMVDNVLQSPSAFTVSGTTLTLSSAPASGTNNIRVWIMGRELDIGKPAAGTVGQTEIDTTSLSPLVQTQRTNESNVVTCSVAIPADDTIPQNTEGTEVVTVTITPKSATNKLVVEAQIIGTPTAGDNVSMALFKDSESDARASSMIYTASSGRIILTLDYEMVAGSTSAITFSVRVGRGTTATFYVNGLSAGTRLHGGVMNSFIKVTEIAQ